MFYFSACLKVKGSIYNTGKSSCPFNGGDKMIIIVSSISNVCLHLPIIYRSNKISNDQELIQSDPISSPQNQTGNN